MDERWKSAEIRAAQAELSAAIESPDKIIAEAVRGDGSRFRRARSGGSS